MTLWRPKNRTEWWLAFVASLTAIPFMLNIAGIGISQALDFPAIYLFGLVVGPIYSCYLLAVTRLPTVSKVIVIPLLFAAIGFTYLPRSTCGDESFEVAKSECR